MSAPRDIRDYLEDILDAMEKIKDFIAKMSFDEFKHDDKTVYAVIRGLEIVGEATKKIPLDFRKRYPAVPWQSMAAMRDKLIHDYIGVNLLVVWKTATEELPECRLAVRSILSELE